jgi:hypothetical protein
MTDVVWTAVGFVWRFLGALAIAAVFLTALAISWT